jgi:hypothetical protein
MNSANFSLTEFSDVCHTGAPQTHPNVAWLRTFSRTNPARGLPIGGSAHERPKRCGARQTVNVLGALFQVFARLVLAGANPGTDAVFIQPSAYAFFAWAPIFVLSIAYAAYQALPANRQRNLFRRTGWLTAAAFLFNGVLEWSGDPVVGQVLVLGMLACLAVAFLRLSRPGMGASGAAEHLVAVRVTNYACENAAAPARPLTLRRSARQERR